jgi:hypothetical protein
VLTVFALSLLRISPRGIKSCISALNFRTSEKYEGVFDEKVASNNEQTEIIEKYMLEYIDGVECWHSRNDEQTTAHYIEFAEKHGLLMTGGSDCHQKPLLMGTVDIPDWVAEQFRQ